MSSLSHIHKKTEHETVLVWSDKIFSRSVVVKISDERCLSNKIYEILNTNEFHLTALPVKRRKLECTLKSSSVFQLNVVGSRCHVKFGYVLRSVL